MLTIYKASAGSGKTFTLTYRYIKLLISSKDDTGRYRLRRNPHGAHRSILAVTFTNKATDEMKRRIIHELAVLGGMEPGWTAESPYSGRLISELGCTAEQLSATAREVLIDLLFDFNFFQVSTIDSFFQTILRTFAREAELTGNYEVDIENDRARETGVRNFFESLRSDSGSAENLRMIEWLTRFMLTSFKEGGSATIFNRSSESFSQILKFIKRTETEEFKRHYDSMMEYMADDKKLQKFQHQLAEAREKHAALTSEACSTAIKLIEAAGYTDGKLKISANALKKLQAVRAAGYDPSTEEGSTVSKAIDNPRSVFNAALQDALEKNPDPILESAISRAFSLMHEGRVMRALWSQLLREIYRLGLVRGVYRFIEQYRTENNTMPLSETNTLLRKIIGDDDTPFVFERIGVWLNHFLIDEFQDTSLMQWEIMRPLVNEGLSRSNDSLIIGDEKQCIYRFRSSDPSLLQNQVETEFSDRSRLEGATPAENTNWRSSRHVVEFNNALFRRLAETLGLNEVYANVEQQIPEKNLQNNGYIRVNTVTASKKPDFQAIALELLTADIRRQLKAGYRGKDIAVLMRGGTEAILVIDHLMNLTASDPDFAGLRVISDDSMMLSSAPAVKLIISIMRHLDSLDDPRPDSSDRRLTTGLKRMINRFEYARCLGETPEDAIKSAVTDTEGNFDIRRDVADMTCFNLVSLIERIVSSELFDKNFLKSQCMFISAFQDAVADYSVSGDTDLHSFLEWWDSVGSRLSVCAPDDENAIRVMTIHKSKGLEFPCVHVPMLMQNMIDFRDTEWFEKASLPLIDSDVIPPLLPVRPSKILLDTDFAGQYERRRREQLLDELNVLYVALTRAVDELSVTCMSSGSLPDSIPVGDLMALTVPEMECMRDETPDDTPEVTTLVYGEPTVRRPDRIKPRSAIDPDSTFFMPPYSTDDRSDLWDNTRLDDMPDYSEARGRGTALHDVLARCRHASDLPKAVACCVHACLLPRTDAPDVEKHLREELERPDVRPWFSGFRRVACERSILCTDGRRRRPDRIVWTADGHVDVIDYKFGAEEKKHHNQVSRYVRLLRDSGETDVRGFLWYVDSGKICQVRT